MTARVEESRNQVDCLHWYSRSERTSHIMIKSSHKTHWWGKILTTTPFLFDYWHRQRPLSPDQTWRAYIIYVFMVYCMTNYLYVYKHISYIYFSFASMCILYERYWTWIVSAKLDTFAMPRAPRPKYSDNSASRCQPFLAASGLLWLMWIVIFHQFNIRSNWQAYYFPQEPTRL